jgi:hypothetical protein
MMPGTKIKGAFLTLFDGSIISDSLEVLSGVFGINGVRCLGFEHLLPDRNYQYFSVFRHLSILIIPAFLGIQFYATNYTLLPVHWKVLR